MLLFSCKMFRQRPLRGVKLVLYILLSDQFNSWFQKLLFTSLLDGSSFKNVFEPGLPLLHLALKGTGMCTYYTNLHANKNLLKGEDPITDLS